MTNQFFAASPTPQNTEKPAEKTAPIGDQPIPAPASPPGSAPGTNS